MKCSSLLRVSSLVTACALAAGATAQDNGTLSLMLLHSLGQEARSGAAVSFQDTGSEQCRYWGALEKSDGRSAEPTTKVVYKAAINRKSCGDGPQQPVKFAFELGTLTPAPEIGTRYLVRTPSN